MDAEGTNQTTEVDQAHLQTVSLTANKSQLGHTISASGAIEAIMTVKAIKEEIVPGILNLENPIETELSLLREKKEQKVKVALKNSFAFGGINTSLVFEKLS